MFALDPSGIETQWAKEVYGVGILKSGDGGHHLTFL
jgi:hypothetical protein